MTRPYQPLSTMIQHYQPLSGWWFGTFFIFSHLGFLIIPADFHIFQRGGSTTNQLPTMARDFPLETIHLGVPPIVGNLHFNHYLSTIINHGISPFLINGISPSGFQDEHAVGFDFRHGTAPVGCCVQLPLWLESKVYGRWNEKNNLEPL